MVSAFNYVVVQGHSMEPFLCDGDRVLIRKTRTIDKGKKVVFHHPQKGYLVCKRCVAMPGEMVIYEHSSQDTSVYSKIAFAPARNSVIQLDSLKFRYYSHVIAYETRCEPIWQNGAAFLEGKPIEYYCFLHDWYYFLGDNRSHSTDSRHYGLIPDDYIVGTIKVIFNKHLLYLL